LGAEKNAQLRVEEIKKIKKEKTLAEQISLQLTSSQRQDYVERSHCPTKHQT
jgi:hypothetical protein